MDTFTLWSILTLATSLAVTGLILYYIHVEKNKRGGREPLTDENGKHIRLPLTILQIRALWALGIGTATLLWIVTLFVEHGAENYYAQDSMRIAVYLIALGGAAAYGIVHMITGLRNRGVAKDERDMAVLHWAPTVQVTGMTLTLAVWAIGLTETYWSAGYVPIAFPILIFLSTLIVGGLFQALGILIGYRRF